VLKTPTHPLPVQPASPKISGFTHETPKKRRLFFSLLVGGMILLLLSSLVFLVLTTNQGRQQGSATTNARVGTATALSDQATSQAQQTASVSNGHATATAAVHATATAKVRNQQPGYFAGTGNKIIYNEALDGPGTWETHSDSHGGSCQFANNAYHVVESNAGSGFICADLNEVTGGNEQVEVEVMFVKGDCAALHIRYRINSSNTYPFRVCSNGSAQIVDHTNGQDIILGSVDPGSIPLKPDWNSIGFETNDVNNTITGYVNGKRVLTVNDDGINRIGNFALEAISTNTSTEVAYRNLRAWMKPSS
jgi:hypothetical protein